MKTRRGTRPIVGDLFELAEAVGLFYGAKGTEAAIEEFREVAQDYRYLAKRDGQVAWLTYVLRLLLTCPVLLQRPPGLEWVTDDLEWALRYRKFRPEVDRDFWAAVKNVRGLLTRGHPGNKSRDFFRYQTVQDLMYPFTTHPTLGLVRSTKPRVSKTRAVTEYVAMEARWAGRRPASREIWRSLQRVEDYFGRLQAQVERARTNVAARARKRRHSQSGQG